MGIFDPDYIFARTTNITPQFLEDHGIKYLLLDVDNTLTTHNNPEPSSGIDQWLDEMRKAGVGMIIISNNNKERVAPFAARLGLPFNSMSLKPLSLGFSKGLKKLGANKNNTAVVGDQIFTDVMGANLMGLKSLMVLPIEPEDIAAFKFKRKLEKPITDRYFATHGEAL